MSAIPLGTLEKVAVWNSVKVSRLKVQGVIEILYEWNVQINCFICTL